MNHSVIAGLYLLWRLQGKFIKYLGSFMLYLYVHMIFLFDLKHYYYTLVKVAFLNTETSSHRYSGKKCD